jgi:hypothetical protein
VITPQILLPQQSLSLKHGIVSWQHTPLRQLPEHDPQLPPQPSGPQFFPAQFGVQQLPP